MRLFFHGSNVFSQCFSFCSPPCLYVCHSLWTVGMINVFFFVFALVRLPVKGGETGWSFLWMWASSPPSSGFSLGRLAPSFAVALLTQWAGKVSYLPNLQTELTF